MFISNLVHEEEEREWKTEHHSSQHLEKIVLTKRIDIGQWSY